MRVLQVIFTAIFAALAIIGGLVAAAVVAAIGLTIVLVRRLLGQPPALSPRRPRPPQKRPEGDVIEVSATEVTPVDSPRNRLGH